MPIVVRAFLPGDCPICHEPILAGLDMVILCDAAGGWVHEDCDDCDDRDDYW